MIPFHPELAKALLAAGGPEVYGKRTAPTAPRSMLDAIFVAQIDYWNGKGANHHGGYSWCYNSRHAWAEQLGTTQWLMRESLDRLISLGAVATMRNPKLNLDKRPWLRIDHERLQEIAPLVKLRQSTDSPLAKDRQSTGEGSPMDWRSIANGSVKLRQWICEASPDNTEDYLQETNTTGLAQETYSGSARVRGKGSSSDSSSLSNGSRPKVPRDRFAALRAKVAEEKE